MLKRPRARDTDVSETQVSPGILAHRDSKLLSEDAVSTSVDCAAYLVPDLSEPELTCSSEAWEAR